MAPKGWLAPWLFPNGMLPVAPDLFPNMGLVPLVNPPTLADPVCLFELRNPPWVDP